MEGKVSFTELVTEVREKRSVLLHRAVEIP